MSTRPGPRSRRRWSIRLRTALAFGIAFVALSVLVLVFVNLMAQRGIDTALGTMSGTPSLAPDPAAPTDGSGGAPEDGAVVAVVADQQWLWSGVGVGIAALAAAGVGWFLSRRMLAPLDAITVTATRISATTLHERIELDGPDDELRRLADTIDALFARLETSFEAQRQFIAHASHELRTPLAVQRATLQIGLEDTATPSEIRAVRAELLDANRQTEHLVASLLTLAEAERGLRLRESVDMPGIVDGVFADLCESASAADVRLARPAWPAVPVVDGDPTLVRQLLHNLVDNAIEYNVGGGSVTVDAGADWFMVSNSGPVVSNGTDGLMRPFVRGGAGASNSGSTARRHSGLGLSIVDAIARVHGWRCVVEAPPTGGLRVRIVLGAGVSSM